MSYQETIQQTAKLVEALGVEWAWQQWASLGAGALTSAPDHSDTLVDPEALLLLSLVMQPSERRLADLVAWWAAVGSSLLSVQRTKTLVAVFPETVREALGGFAYLASKAGDKRWKKLASPTAPMWGDRRLKGPSQPPLKDASALVLRLRAGFGVNAKSDALAYLIGMQQRAATVQEIAEAIHYTKVTVRNALQDMVLARFIQEVPGHPAKYTVDRRPWLALLNASKQTGSLVWKPWSGLFAFLAHTHLLYAQADALSEYLLSTKARDLVGRFGKSFALFGVPLLNPNDYQGAAYLDGVHEAFEHLRMSV